MAMICFAIHETHRENLLNLLARRIGQAIQAEKTHFFNAFVRVAGHTRVGAAQTYLDYLADQGGRSPMNCLRTGIITSMIFALAPSVPGSAFAQRAHKFVDTFDQRYPVEQAPTPSADAPQSEPAAQQIQTATPRNPRKVIARSKGAITLKRSASRSVSVSRSYAHADAGVLLGNRNSVDHISQQIYFEWVVVRWASSDCKIWHNDMNIPAGYGWNAIAFANTSDNAFLKMTRLYRRGDCV
jgi:hypothetical protein